MPSFGLLFNDFLISLGEETGAVALITSSFFSALSFAGLFTNTLFKKFSMRTVGLIGASIYFVGSLMTVFVTSVEQLMISFSFFQGKIPIKISLIYCFYDKNNSVQIISGAGFGFMIPVAYTSFNSYFVKQRVAMMSIAQALIGVGSMIYPILMQFLIETYGFRGSMAILAAINSHSIVGMMVMHPVKWHYKINKIPIDETKSCKLFLNCLNIV